MIISISFKMEVMDTTTSNHLKETEDSLELDYDTSIVSDNQRYMCALVIYVFLCGFICVFGSIANIINLIIFYKQRLNTTINISFFAMAICDLCSLLLQQLLGFYDNPLFQSCDIPIVYTDVQYVTGGVPRATMARITCLITVYITAERCLCIAFPLHIKQMITPKRTTTIIILIYSLTFLSIAPFYFTPRIEWKFYPDRNKTLLGLVVTSYNNAVEAAVYFIHAIVESLCILLVLVFTSILIHKLREKNAWRKTANVRKNERSEALSNRDRKTMSMVVLIASILIICYTPSMLLCATTFFVPEFSVGGRQYNLVYILWSFAVLFETINSSVNIFLYLKMSTKYRQTFLEIFPCCARSKKNTDTII